jgi:hypothetical protein
MPLRNFLEDMEELDRLLEEGEYDAWVDEVFVPFYLLPNTPTEQRVVSFE